MEFIKYVQDSFCGIGCLNGCLMVNKDLNGKEQVPDLQHWVAEGNIMGRIVRLKFIASLHFWPKS